MVTSTTSLHPRGSLVPEPRTSSHSLRAEHFAPLTNASCVMGEPMVLSPHASLWGGRPYSSVCRPALTLVRRLHGGSI